MTSRELALQALYRFDTKGDYVRETLDRLLRQSRFDARDRGFITELAYGTVRWRGRIDWMLEQVSTRRLDTLTPWIRNILRLGVYQIAMLDQVPDAAAIHESVSLAKRYGHRGTAGFTNAVLRAVSKNYKTFRYPDVSEDPAGHAAVLYSYPRWMVERWLKRYGLEAVLALCDAGNRTPPVTVRIRGIGVDAAALAARWRDAGIEAEPGRYLDDFMTLRGAGDVTELEAYRRGWIQVQDESAGLAVRLLDPQPGETIVDLCGAPGGKTVYAADRMGDRGRVLTVDVSLPRLRRVRENVERLGLTSVSSVIADGRTIALRTPADRVLVDAPCSGLGTIARRAELRWRRTPEDTDHIRSVQKALLAHSAELVKPGGVIVYSTCTIEPEENEAIVSDFCARHPAFRLDPPSVWPDALAGVMDAEGFVRTLPSVHGIDGSFAARLRMKR